MNTNKVKVFLENEPLIYARPSMAMIDESFMKKPSGSIYYGTGLVTPTAPSVGLPFDVLILILVAEKLRRQFGLDQIYHHVADTHALANDFTDKTSLEKIASEYREVLKRISRVSDIKLNVMLSSDFDSNHKYQEILKGIKTDRGEYVQRELADVLWYRKQHNVRLKLGWLVQSAKTEIGFDERLYDQEFKAKVDSEMSFIYTVAGRNFDRKRQKVAPYIAIPSETETRILLKPDEDVRAKYAQALKVWPDRSMGGAIKQLNQIVRLWDRLTDHKRRGRGRDLIERIQAIIDEIFA